MLQLSKLSQVISQAETNSAKEENQTTTLTVSGLKRHRLQQKDEQNNLLFSVNSCRSSVGAILQGTTKSKQGKVVYAYVMDAVSILTSNVTQNEQFC